MENEALFAWVITSGNESHSISGRAYRMSHSRRLSKSTSAFHLDLPGVYRFIFTQLSFIDFDISTFAEAPLTQMITCLWYLHQLHMMALKDL